MKFTPPIKGKYLKKRSSPGLSGLELTESVSSIAEVASELKRLKQEVIDTVDSKVQEVDAHLEALNNANEAITTTRNEALEMIKGIKEGPPGNDADEEKIVTRIRSYIPQQIDVEDLELKLLSKVPKIGDLTNAVLKALPKNKASLKVIQERFEVDPMSVVQKIMELPEGKFQLSTKHIEGLEQTISAFQSQLGRGYLHGGGDTVVAGTNITITTNSAGQKVISASGGGGSGDVTGPASSTDNAIARFDGITGKLIQNSGVLINDANGVSTTVADTGNTVGLTVTQNDVTNNPRAVSIVNAGTGTALFIDANGNNSTSTSVGGTVLIDTTGSTGSGLTIYSNQATPASGATLLSLRADNVGFDKTVASIIHDGEGLGLLINQTNTTDGQGLRIIGNSTAGTAYQIKLEAPSPEIEFSQTNLVAPAGNFEIGVNGDQFYIAGRKADNTGFEESINFPRLANGGGIKFAGTISGETLLVPSAVASGTLTLPAATGTLMLGATSSTDNAIARFDGTTGAIIQNSGVTINDASGISTTIADTGNTSGLTITQNDTTNNPDGVTIANTTTGKDISITDSAAKSTSSSSGGAILLNLTNATAAGIGLNIRALNTGTSHSLVRVNSTSAFTTTVSGAQTIDTSSTQLTVASTAGFPSSGTIRVTNSTSSTENSRSIILHYTSIDTTHFIGSAGVFYKESTSINLINNAIVDYLEATQTASIIEVIDNSTNGGMVNLKVTGVNPDIEFISKSGLDGSVGEGKFEIDVPTGDNVTRYATDVMRFNGRSDANSGFNTAMLITRPGLARQGMVGIGFQNLLSPVTMAAHLHVKNDTNFGDSNAAALIVSIFQGAASQTANLTEWRNDSGTALSFVAANGDISVPDEAYGVGWDGSLEVPTKNAVYDKIQTISGGITWVEVTGTSQSAAVNKGYITNNAGLVTVTLPSTAAVGDTVEVTGKGAGGWKIAQNASGVIHFGNLDTTTGTGGSIASTATRDGVRLVCVVANNEWNLLSSVGNITIV